MRLNKILIFAVVMIEMMVAMPAFAADVAKIGVVDFQKVMSESESGKTVQAMMDKRRKEMETELLDVKSKIEELTNQLNKDAMVMSKEKRDDKQRELEIKKYDYQTLQRKYEAEFRDLYEKYSEKIRKEIFALAKEYGEKEGYLLIIEQTAVIYYPDSIDITEILLKAYNKKYPADKALTD